ncbi:Lrp/AsnC family transcriptional regulator [Leeia sp. TBRC 13508]|uniref:Lrp/AsnC family transcriptional regulator n=1 Tax=Leeia speluncae TaxID=2884804 RepID=A0ABS8D8X5_9NEIS|nr:Lrp/AsnC family transcriptional regulator [Leeia speluncae]MCB6184624.1 Lrp/AsnC family transcriptional regulator [Leeia speluncae]
MQSYLPDNYDRKILAALQEDARMSHAEIGRRVHLSQPAVSERIRRLEQHGVILGYQARVDPTKLGYPITAVIRVASQRGRPYEPYVREKPEVIDCYTVTGEDCAVLKVLAQDIPHLQQLIEDLNQFGNTSTAIVLSTHVAAKPILPPERDV